MKKILSVSFALLTLASFSFAKPKKEEKKDNVTITSNPISLKDSDNKLEGSLVIRSSYETKGKPRSSKGPWKKDSKTQFTFTIESHSNEMGEGDSLKGENGLNISLKRTGIADATPKKGIVTKTKENVTGNEKKNVEEVYQANLSLNDLEKINKSTKGNNSYTFTLTTKSGKKYNFVAKDTSEINEIFDELK